MAELLGEDMEALVALAGERYPATRLLGSTHVVGRRTSRAVATDLFRRCELGGAADGAKVVLTAFSEVGTDKSIEEWNEKMDLIQGRKEGRKEGVLPAEPDAH